MKKIRNLFHFFLLLLILFFFFLQYQIFSSENLDKDPPKQLHPIVQEKKEELIKLAGDVGIRLVITDDFRSFEEQDRLYEKGRTSDGAIVTYAKGGESYHNYGLAIDFALLDINGVIIWDMEYDGNGNKKSDWMEVVSLAKELGFTWGGDWQNFKDYPHLQMDFDLSINDLQRGKRP